MDLSWTTFAGIALGIGLAAATGFRVFLPLLLAGLAAHFGYIPLAENFQWLASIPALVMLGTAAAGASRPPRIASTTPFTSCCGSGRREVRSSSSARFQGVFKLAH